MPEKKSFDRGNGRFLGGRYRKKTPCNSPTKRPSSSGFEGDYFDLSNDIGEASTCGMSFRKGQIRGSNSLKSRRSNLLHLKPLSSLDSCLMAQLYKEHAEMEYVPVPLPSPCTPAFRPFSVSDGNPCTPALRPFSVSDDNPCTPALRPFLVSDGTQIISRSSCDSFNLHGRDDKGKSHIKVYTEANETVSGGIPHLPEIGSDEGLKEQNAKRRKDQNRNVSNKRRTQNESQISSQGSPTGAVLFCLGVSFGVISSILANKAEVTKLHDLLKQTENLVQDLHEELEMKDSLTVKELVNEDAFSLANEISADRFKPNEPLVHTDINPLMKCVDGATGSLKAAETIESISTIEAELEAELEQLELNMKKPTLNGRLSDDDDELDPELMVEVVQGEFRADILYNKSSSEPSLDHNSSSSSSPTPRSPKQAVCPRELSLRLHQVIQSRLEQRITELEAALEESDKRVLQLQSEQQLSCSWRGFSQTDMSVSSFSTRDSPNTIGGSTPVDFYNAAFQEPEKINRSVTEKQNDTENDLFLLQPTNAQPETPMDNSGMMETFFVDDENDEEDEDLKLLIKQIVEKTRQGSPAVLQAHRALVYLDKNEE